jgi:hypothetical protein
MRMHANDHFVNRGSSASPLTRRQILRGVVATASAASLPGITRTAQFRAMPTTGYAPFSLRSSKTARDRPTGGRLSRRQARHRRMGRNGLNESASTGGAGAFARRAFLEKVRSVPDFSRRR